MESHRRKRPQFDDQPLMNRMDGKKPRLNTTAAKTVGFALSNFVQSGYDSREETAPSVNNVIS